jgi:hypothetical protein
VIRELLLCLAVASAQPTVKGPLGEQPVATMQGKVVAISSKKISVKLSDDNVLDFHVTRKTKFYANGKQADAKIVKVGEPAVMEAIRAGDGSLDALNVRVDRPKTDSK